MSIIEVIEIASIFEVFAIVLEIEKETTLLVIVYHMPGPLGSFFIVCRGYLSPSLFK